MEWYKISGNNGKNSENSGKVAVKYWKKVVIVVKIVEQWNSGIVVKIVEQQ